MSTDLQARTLFLFDDRQVALLLQAHHSLVQALPQRSEFQAQVSEPLVGEPVRLHHWLTVVFAPASQHSEIISASNEST
jgi:hypothetical protein